MTRRTLIGITVATALTAVLERTPLIEAHGNQWWQHLAGFDLVYGFAGCAAIVLVSKALGAAWLQRDERYYGEDR